MEDGDNYRDVVVTAALISQVDQALPDAIDFLFFNDNPGDFIPTDGIGEAIAAEDQSVSILKGLGREIHLDRGVGTEGLENDVAPVAGGGLRFSQFPRIYQTLGQRLIPGELSRRTFTNQVGSGISDLGQEEAILADCRHCGSGAHTVQIGVFDGILMDLSVGCFNRLAQVAGEALVRNLRIIQPEADQMLMNRGCGHFTGDFTGNSTSHSIGNQSKKAASAEVAGSGLGASDRGGALQVCKEEGILIMLSGESAVGQTEIACAD